jgi:hypothetical protein
MRRHAARGNRTGLGLLGLALLLAGAALAAVSLALFGHHNAAQPIYPPPAQRYIHQHSWIWSLVAAAAIIIGLLCLRWLLVQPRRDTLRRVRIDSDQTSEPGSGRTLVLSAAVADIAEDELAAQSGVRRVSAALSGSPDQPEIWITLVADPAADLAQLRDHFAEKSLPSIRSALGQPQLTAYLSITVRSRAERSRTSKHGVLIGHGPP